jgi:hypothetical protein
VDFPKSAAGASHILIMVDVATRYVVTKPLKDLKKETMARALYEVFTVFGPPKIMQSDNGVEFINEAVAKLTKAAGVDHRRVAPYNPRANGLAERTVQSIKALLKKRLSGAMDRWDDALPGVTLDINNTDGGVTKSSPFSLFFGRAANAWSDYTTQELILQFGEQDLEVLQQLQRRMTEEVRSTVRKSVDERQQKQNQRLDENRPQVTVDYPPGALVMVKDTARGHSLDPVWLGPYLVVRKNKRSGTYMLRDQNNKVLDRALPVSQLKFVADTRVPLMSEHGEPVREGERAVVDVILDHRVHEQLGTEYLVHWKNTSVDEDSWVPAADFDSPAILAAYHKRVAPTKARASNARRAVELRVNRVLRARAAR